MVLTANNKVSNFQTTSEFEFFYTYCCTIQSLLFSLLCRLFFTIKFNRNSADFHVLMYKNQNCDQIGLFTLKKLLNNGCGVDQNSTNIVFHKLFLLECFSLN